MKLVSDRLRFVCVLAALWVFSLAAAFVVGRSFAVRGASVSDTAPAQGPPEKQNSSTEAMLPEVAPIAQLKEEDRAYPGAIGDRLRMAMGEANRVKRMVRLAEVLEDLDPSNVWEVVAMFEQAGFELVASSEINANPKDKPVVGDSVWRLPPSLRTADENKAANQAIGETDRMTLKFRKIAR